uniref:Uncharacterized protein n=1 Tax=Tanacetum cinerariifolium TaxID=118510 RepID=A0A6L2LLB0_TANCI|nr:hypothetical protein [Tanacetum cinerariifolium]GEU62611.1 hypothetical protein [Tanacetum cinerariifolium]
MKCLINSEYRDEIKIDELWVNFNKISIEINKKEKLQQLDQMANLSTYPSKYFNSFCYDDDDDEDYTVVITPDFPISDSLIMENEHLDTIPETESYEFIKSSVENLVPIPSESEDFFRYQNDDKSSHEEVIHEMSFKTYSNPLFDLDGEIISSEFNPIHNEDLDSTLKNDRFDTNSYLLESLLNRDESIPLVTYLILLSSESEDTIFDPGISDYHFSSFMSGVSHRSGTFMKFIVYPNHLNESPMKILSSTCSLMDQ